MDSKSLQDEYGVEVMCHPEESHLVYDSTEDKFKRFTGWSEAADAFHLNLLDESTATVRKYLHPTNRYYLVFSSSFEENR